MNHSPALRRIPAYDSYVFLEKELEKSASDKSLLQEYAQYADHSAVTEEQLQGFLANNHALISYEHEDHGQSPVSFDEFWAQSSDDEGNTVYTGSWTGPEPEVKLLPSDSARFMNFKVTYDAASQVAVCHVEEGGGIG